MALTREFQVRFWRTMTKATSGASPERRMTVKASNGIHAIALATKRINNAERFTYIEATGGSQ